MKRTMTFLLMLVMCANLVATFAMYYNTAAEICVEADQKESKEEQKKYNDYLDTSRFSEENFAEPAQAMFNDFQIIYSTPSLPNQTPPPDVSC